MNINKCAEEIRGELFNNICLFKNIVERLTTEVKLLTNYKVSVYSETHYQHFKKCGSQKMNMILVWYIESVSEYILLLSHNLMF